MSEKHTPPDPLPRTIPMGIPFDTNTPGAFGETMGELTLGADGAYHGPAVIRYLAAEPSERPNRVVRPDRVDWETYRMIADAMSEG
jgi:hypothetical protein